MKFYFYYICRFCCLRPVRRLLFWLFTLSYMFESSNRICSLLICLRDFSGLFGTYFGMKLFSFMFFSTLVAVRTVFHLFSILVSSSWNPSFFLPYLIKPNIHISWIRFFLLSKLAASINFCRYLKILPSLKAESHVASLSTFLPLFRLPCLIRGS